MTEKNSVKKIILTILALVLFLFTRWVFLLIEINAAVDLGYFIVEGILIVLIYSISLFSISKVINGAVAILGCAGLCVYSFCLDGAVTTTTFYPLTLLPVFLFFISQYKSKVTDGNAVRVVWKVLMTGYMIGFPVAIGYVIFGGLLEPGKVSVYAIFIFVAVILVYYYVLMQMREKSMKNKKQKNKKHSSLSPSEKSAEDRWIRFGFLFACIALLENGIYLVLVKDDVMVHVIPLLWVINLFFLYDQGHTAVCQSANSIKEKFMKL